MIKIENKEEIEGDYAKFKRVVTFFRIPIYENVSYTTNSEMISQFKKVKQTKVKGFKHEN